MNVSKLILSLIMLLGLSFISPVTHAQWERSLAIEVPIINLNGELGFLTENANYIAADVSLSVEGSYSLIDLNWLRPTSEKHKHWFGAGLGIFNWNEFDDDYDFFDDDKNEVYLSLNYKYFRKGLEAQGFFYALDIKIADGDTLGFASLGYNF